MGWTDYIKNYLFLYMDHIANIYVQYPLVESDCWFCCNALYCGFDLKLGISIGSRYWGGRYAITRSENWKPKKFVGRSSIKNYC